MTACLPTRARSTAGRLKCLTCVLTGAGRGLHQIMLAYSVLGLGLLLLFAGLSEAVSLSAVTGQPHCLIAG